MTELVGRTVARDSSEAATRVVTTGSGLLDTIFSLVEVGDVIVVPGLREVLVVDCDWWGGKFIGCPGLGLLLYSEGEEPERTGLAARALNSLRRDRASLLPALERRHQHRLECASPTALLRASDTILEHFGGTGHLSSIDNTTYVVVNVAVVDSTGEFVEMRRVIGRVAGRRRERIELLTPLAPPLMYEGLEHAPESALRRFVADSKIIINGIADKAAARAALVAEAEAQPSPV